MTYKEYKDKVNKTSSKEKPCKNSYLKNGLTNNIIHSLMGLENEYVEFMLGLKAEDKENIIEEAGDFTWFLTLMVSEIGGETEERFEKMFNNHYVDKLVVINEEEVLDNLDNILGVAKAILFYKKDVNLIKIAESAINVWLYVIIKTRLFTTADFNEIIKYNINKLNKRYKKGVFTNEDAINRADKKS